MGTIAIAVDGKQVFNWQGDEVEAKQILKDFRRAARHAGLTPEEFSDNCVKHLRDGRLLSEGRVGQEMQMMGVVWRILEMETNDPEHPGRFADYIGNTNFDVDLRMHGGGFTATIAATILAMRAVRKQAAVSASRPTLLSYRRHDHQGFPAMGDRKILKTVRCKWLLRTRRTARAIRGMLFECAICPAITTLMLVGLRPVWIQDSQRS